MAIIIHTNQPNLLLDKIYDAIDAKKADKWERTTDGRLTYGALLWKNEAFFKPQIWVDEQELRFGLLKRKDRKHISSKLYTVFHTKLVKMLLSHFDTSFSEVTITAVRVEPDDF
jgi:CRISPR/Cas system CSM-associated protein Csm2 small subunit